MSNFVLIGPINRQSAVCGTVFRDVRDGKLADARYMNIISLFGGSRLLFHALTNKRTMFALRKLPRLQAAVIRFARGPLLDRTQRVRFRKLDRLISRDAENYIVFVPGVRLYLLPPAVVESIRGRYPDCHLIFYLIDAVERLALNDKRSEDAVIADLDHFDAVYTYDRANAERYSDHMQFIDIPMWHAPAALVEPEVQLYFCGRNKHRDELLLAIHKRVADAGMRCRMQIAMDGNLDGIHPDITQIRWLPYEDTVRDLQKSNCILEVLASHNNESTLRYKEAVIYNKKLLTNNPNIANLPYYDPRWMRTFETAEDIDLDWLRAVEPVDYGYRGDYTAERFVKTVEEKYRRDP